MSRDRIFGLIGIIWGGAVILYRLFGSVPAGAAEGYTLGRNISFVLGVFMLILGLIFFFKRQK